MSSAAPSTNRRNGQPSAPSTAAANPATTISANSRNGVAAAAAKKDVTFANNIGQPLAQVVGSAAGAAVSNVNTAVNATIAATNQALQTAAKNTGLAASAVLTAFSPETSFLSFKILVIFLIIAVALFYFIQSNIFSRVINQLNSAPSDSNNDSIKNAQIKAIRGQVDDSAAKKKGVFSLLTDCIKEAFTDVKESFMGLADLKASLPDLPASTNTLLQKVESGAVPKMPALPSLSLPLIKAKPTPAATVIGISCDKAPPPKERALLNFAVLGCRVAGYLGPRMNGVFAETEAIESALKMGCRLFIFDIDYLNKKPSRPVLVCRDENGNLLSNNTGSIQKAAAALVAFTRRQRAAGTDPILVVLNIRRLPGPAGNTSSPSSRPALQFMSEVARQLSPMYPYLLKSTEEGDAQQQRLQDVLFKLPITRFENQIVLMTNVDTSGFADSDEIFEPQRDLNLLVNARIFSNNAGALQNYSAPISDVPLAAVANSVEYYLEVPPTNYNSEIETARNVWSMAMPKAIGAPPSAAELDILVNKLGVQGIIIHPFPNIDGKFKKDKEESAMATGIYAKEFFGEYGYIPKPGPLRYKEPDAIVIPPADPKLNANGGLLVVPSSS